MLASVFSSKTKFELNPAQGSQVNYAALAGKPAQYEFCLFYCIPTLFSSRVKPKSSPYKVKFFDPVTFLRPFMREENLNSFNPVAYDLFARNNYKLYK